MTVTTVASYTPADRVPTAYSLGGSVASVYVQNDSQHELRVLTAAGQAATVPAYDRMMLRTNATWGAWLAISPYVRRINAPYAASGTVTVTSYDTGDTLPDGTTYTTVYAGPAQVREHDELDRLVGTGHLNVKYWGARGDGTTDDTTALQATLDFANTIGGGVVYLPAGTYVSGRLTLYSNVYLRGDGENVTILQLKSAANVDLIWGGSTNQGYINVTNQTSGNGNTGGLANWGISDMTLDGNKAGQSSGTSYVLEVYGLNFTLQNLHIRNGYSGGAVLDWNGGNTPAGQDGMEARIRNVKLRGNNGVGLTWGGPHDSQWSDVLSENSGTHGVYIGPHANGLLVTNLHSWGIGSGAISILCEANSVQFTNCVAEGSDTTQLVILGQGVMWTGGNIYGTGVTNSTGVQLGQAAGNTPYSGSAYQSAGLTTAVPASFCQVLTQLSAVTGAHGAVWFGNDGGHNIVQATLSQASGSMFTGTVSSSTMINWTTSGLTGGGNLALLQLPGQLVLARSGVQTPTNNGTITTQGFSIERVQPAGNITGIILQQPSFFGAYCIVLNQSAFTISFAASATSHIADEAGGTSPMAANTARAFAYDGTLALWYRCA